MNRLSFIKSLIGAPLIPLTGIAEEKEEVIQGNLEKCIPQWPYSRYKLFPFQQEIWEDYNIHKNNLFIMSRGCSKSFMASLIASLSFGPQMGIRLKTDRGVKYLVSLEEIIIDELEDNSFYRRMANNHAKTTIFTSVYHNEGFLKELVDSGEWNIKLFNIENITPILYDKKQLDRAKSSMPKEEFEREFLCKFC